MASAHQVFTIPEILEIIIFHLPEQDLLLLQRVNKTWLDIIKTSPHLQQKLFYTASVLESAKSVAKIKWNPFLRHFMKCRGQRLAHQKVELDVVTIAQADYPTASWKNMFFTQPAASGMLISKIQYDSYIVSSVMNRADGVRMGQMRHKSYWGAIAADVETRMLTHFRFLVGEESSLHDPLTTYRIKTDEPGAKWLKAVVAGVYRE
ncbi:hypothetical protein MMC28_002368 [Mycoblastus sanguinarius]|nr:hypothetical protein [Mycoblastus sanguinarius]